MLQSHSFVQSIAHINDSGTFESSFEIKYLQSTPQRQKNRRLNEYDRKNLLRFVKEFEQLQAYNASGVKSTPKKFKTTNNNTINIGNTTSSSRQQTPTCAQNNIEQDISPSSPSLSSPTSCKYSSVVVEENDMGCKPLACCLDEEDSHDESFQLKDYNNSNCSTESSFDMQPPLMPLYNVTPPPLKQPQRKAAHELARFLRGSFQVKRAKVTKLHRTLSTNENFQNDHLLPEQPKKSSTKPLTAEKAQKKNILEDTTNQRTRRNSINVCTRLFPGNSSPFRRGWEQSSLYAKSTCKNAINGQQYSPKIRCSVPMIPSKSNVFNNTTSSDSKQCTDHHNSSGANQKISMQSQSEKLMTSQSQGVKSWADSFERLLQEPVGLATFAEFLKLEFSAENIYFWSSCERYRNTENRSERQVQAKHIFQKFLANGCRDPVNLDSHSRDITEEMLNNAELNLFLGAQKQIFHLMKFDSYQRFIRSDLYKSCIQAEENNQPLPYGAENLDVLLKTNCLPNASPKLKKSASNAEDHRRKIVLPWHRKTRSKSRDRVIFYSDEHPSSKLNLLSSTLPAQTKPPAENSNNELQQSIRSSLPTSLKAVEAGYSLCRVKFSDNATTIVQIKPNETIQQMVERVLEKRALNYKFYDVTIKGHSKAIDLQSSTQELAGEEVEIEQRVSFKIYLPDSKVISVKSKPKKYLYEVVKPILLKYNYDLETIDVLRRDNHERVDLNQLVTTIDGLRLQTVMIKNGDTGSLIDYQNDNICMKWIKSKELASEILARNANGNNFRNNLRSSQNNLDAITNSIFNDIIHDKLKPENKLQPTDQYSIKSDECGSEASSIFGITNNKKDTHGYNRPIIAKLKAGVKLQVTERVAEKQDELLMSLKTRLDNQTSIQHHENDQMSAVSLRRARANLSPVHKAELIKERPLSTEKLQPLARHSLTNKIQLNQISCEASIKPENDVTTNAANRGPPPLPPKPKVLPTKPSNWGFNISDQTAYP